MNQNMLTHNLVRGRLVFIIATLFAGMALLVLSMLWLTWQAGPVHANPDHRYVALTGSDTTDCTTAISPCRTVQYAVDKASNDDEIRVATGVYTDVHQRQGITQVVYISKTVTIHGGYTSTNNFADPPDPDPNLTTLDAQGLGRVLVIIDTVAPTVDGLRITGGDATGLRGGGPGGDDAGGGVYIYTATATISNCVIYSNTASTASNALGAGGGLYLWLSPATLSGNTVISNTASTDYRGYGGGLCLEYSDATLSGNTVQGNTASTADNGEGGGLYLGHSDNAMLSGNTVQGNTASTAWVGYGGGLYLYYSDATLSGNTVQGNTASTADYGGGGGLYLEYSDATLSGNTVWGNTASTDQSGKGGGLALYYSDATLSGNTVQGNTASTADYGYGGGLCLYDSDATLSGNTVISNTATLSPTATGLGGGVGVGLATDMDMAMSNGDMVAFVSVITLTNNLVADNHANTQGSGLYFKGSSGRLLHNTIADNRSSGQGVCVGPNTTLAFSNTIIAGHASVGITVTTGSTVTLEGTLWHGNGLDTGGTGTILTGTVNVYGDPAFVGPSVWNYHLTAASQAINQGVDAGVATDIDGEVRPQGGAPDIGADESPFPIPPPRPVGGYVVPVSRPELLTPWLGLATLAALAALGGALVRRHKG